MAKVIEGVSDGTVAVGKTRVKWDVKFLIQIYRTRPVRILGKTLKESEE